jgi:hypothetical protein
MRLSRVGISTAQAKEFVSESADLTTKIEGSIDAKKASSNFYNRTYAP